jgi:hypothetical protein
MGTQMATMPTVGKTIESSSVKQQEKKELPSFGDTISIARVQSRIDLVEDGDFFSANSQKIGPVLRQVVSGSFRTLGNLNVDESILSDLFTSTDELDAFYALIFKDIAANAKANDKFDVYHLDISDLAEKTALRLMVLNSNRLSKEYFETKKQNPTVDEYKTEFAQIREKITKLDIKINELQSKIDQNKESISNIEQNNEFDPALAQKFAKIGVSLENVRNIISLINSLDDQYTTPLLMARFVKRSILEFLQNPTVENIQNIRNKANNLNKNKGSVDLEIDGIRRQVINAFSIKDLFDINLDDSDRASLQKSIIDQSDTLIFETLPKNIEIRLESENTLLDKEVIEANREKLILRSREEQVAEKLSDPDSVTQANQQANQKLLELRQNLKGSHQEIINANPELFSFTISPEKTESLTQSLNLDYDHIKSFSQSRPRTIEAYLKLMLDATSDDIDRISKASEVDIKFAFIELGQRMYSELSKEDPKKIFINAINKSEEIQKYEELVRKSKIVMKQTNQL